MTTILTPGDRDAQSYKIVVMGDGSSGKTSIINRYAQDSFGNAYRQTIGLDWYTKRLELPGARVVTLQIWDIGGQQLGGKMIKNYLEGADAITIVYDLTNQDSFENVEDWLSLIRDEFPEGGPHIALIGNKRDASHLRIVTNQAHEDFCKANGLSGHLVSAKTGDQVALAFRRVVAALSGIEVTQAEKDQMARVLTAEVVTHADAPPRSLPTVNRRASSTKMAKVGKTPSKSSLCSIQ
eukprot:m.16602 g.16602  ORF g.16602 m.16602 type:complete len:238 (+) comp11124_c0_seq1:163-876(+)